MLISIVKMNPFGKISGRGANSIQKNFGGGGIRDRLRGFSKIGKIVKKNQGKIDEKDTIIIKFFLIFLVLRMKFPNLSNISF